MTDLLSPTARTFLEGVHFAVLATINDDGTPQQSTLWYELDGDEIVMNTLRGRVKDRNLRRDPRVSVCIADEYTYVAIRGSARLVDEQATAQADARRLTIRYHGEEEGEQRYRSVFAEQQRVTIRVRVERVTEYGL